MERGVVIGAGPTAILDKRQVAPTPECGGRLFLFVQRRSAERAAGLEPATSSVGRVALVCCAVSAI